MQDDGKLLLTLPDKDVQLIQVEFSEEEREVRPYKALVGIYTF